MSRTAFFKVDPKLTSLLGEGYRSVEHAVKELIDNAWDADASLVSVELPDPHTGSAIIVSDDGTGMTPEEVESGYLIIASDRRSRKGDTTPGKRRRVKGRKGIGKFAGLMAASLMQIETRARGKLTRVTVSKSDILIAGKDLEHIPLPIEVHEIDSQDGGTVVSLTDLNQNLTFPNPDRLKRLLVHEYGREEGFTITVNGVAVGVEDVPGSTYDESAEINGVGDVRIRFTLVDAKRIKNPGIVVRVGGKVVGSPSVFGLDDDPEIPTKLLNRVYGEVEADGLADAVTADWGAIIENSVAYQRLIPWVQDKLKGSIETTFSREVNLQKARLQQEINRRLAGQPEYRRHFAEQALEKVLAKFFGESEAKQRIIISLVLDAFEKQEYWAVLSEVERVDSSDVGLFAEALESFGLADLANIGRQAKARIQMLDSLHALVHDDDTLESQVHRVLEKNLWVFGAEYSLMSSNQTTRTIVRKYLDREFSGKTASKRPDLLLARDVGKRRLLAELKRPSHTIDRNDEAQAQSYRDDLAGQLGEIEKVFVVGGRVAESIKPQHSGRGVEFITYDLLIENARTQLEWLLDELSRP